MGARFELRRGRGVRKHYQGDRRTREVSDQLSEEKYRSFLFKREI